VVVVEGAVPPAGAVPGAVVVVVVGGGGTVSLGGLEGVGVFTGELICGWLAAM
jgi:hypothetical protein